MNRINAPFEKELSHFPEEGRDHLRAMIKNGAVLTEEGCEALLTTLEIDLEQLMLRLLPLAKLYASTPVSDYKVGAVVKGILRCKKKAYALYLGANMEFLGQALNQSLHAEQAAVMYAWQRGVKQVQAVAVSESPCGHCRQFLMELEKSDSIRIITPVKQAKKDYRVQFLPELLPQGFGPHDLNRETGMMGNQTQNLSLRLLKANDDPFVAEALNAASQSYAPYSDNLAGCAIGNRDGDIYIGRYAENAAFNPGVSPFQAAICCMNMDRIVKRNEIKRVVLVEKKTKISQYHQTFQLLKSLAPEIHLEYFEAE